MSKKNNKSIKVKKNIEPCPCPSTKETFKNSEKKSLIENFNDVDDSLKNFFGNSKLVIGENNYKLKNYRWLIIAIIIGLLILIVLSIKTESPHPIIVTSGISPGTSGIIAGTSIPLGGLVSTGVVKA